ncbi:TPA: hypothetical protein JS261_001101 [Escherichia coli]|nr:hypothetical protein [Escherichia coli]EKS5472435.1 hypothetical protein [Escherichia coli]HAY0061503.1 hypothetical protein [Escherichia coli]HAY0285145.1 hypothetical protein [Escherichia coli]
MLRNIDRITWKNGWRLNGEPADTAKIRPIFDGRVAAARSVWEKYEEEKAKLREQNLSGAAYEACCRVLSEALGI